MFAQTSLGSQVHRVIVFTTALHSMSSPRGSEAGASKCTALSMATTGAKRRRKKTIENDKASIAAIKEDAEDKHLEEICEHLRGNPSLQMLVLHMLEKGTLQKSAADKEGEAKAAQSANKFQLLSAENWVDILCHFDGKFFQKQVLMKLSKSQLCQIGCFAGCILPASAIISRELKSIASLMVTRSVDILKNRYLEIDMDGLAKMCSEEQFKVKDVNLDWSTVGVFKVKEVTVIGKDDDGNQIEHKEIHIAHMSSGKSTPLPSELHGLPIHENYLETKALFKTKLADIPVKRVFDEAKVQIPEPFWLKRIPDARVSVGSSEKSEGSASTLGGPSLSSLAVVGTPPRAAPKTSPKPPKGSGGSVPPI